MNGEFKGSDSNETEPDAQIRADIERFFATNPTATVVGALGTLTLSPNYRELVEDLQPGSDVDTNIDADADTNAESGGESADSKATTDSGSGPCVVHRSEPHDVYIGRGRSGDGHLNNTDIGETGWLGNPYKLDGPGGGYSRKQSIALYWDDLHYRIEHEPEFARALAQLKGQRLACYCRRSHENEPNCHGDVLMRAIEGLRPVDGSAARGDSTSVDDSPPASESGARSGVGSVGGER